MTNHLAKTSGFVSIPQGDRVVSDPKNGPVCLDPVPGAHKHFSKAKMLFGVLMKGFDPDSLQINGHHLRFGHFQVVGDKESGPVLAFGNKKQHGSDLGQVDQKPGHAKPPLLRSSNGFVFSRSLCQAAERSFPSVHFDNTVSFGGGKKRPSGLNNKVENRGTSVPGIHQDGKWGSNFLDGPGKDFDCNLNFALESTLGRSAFGTVSSYGPDKTLVSGFEDAGNRTKTFDETVGTVVNAEAFDFLSFPGRGRIVENKQRVVVLWHVADLTLVFLLETLDFLGGSLQELVKAVGIVVSKFAGDFPNRTEFHQPNQADQINQKIDSLRFVYTPQESQKIRRNFLGCFLAHGFRALLAFAGIGDFGRKPFYLRSSTASLYLKNLLS